MEFDNDQNNAGTSDDGDNQNQITAEALIGEGKKFKDVDALAKSRIEADNFIEQLKKENAEMRKTVEEAETDKTKSATMSQILDAVRTLSSGGSANDPGTQVLKEAQEDGNQSGLTENDILSIVQRTLEKTESTRLQEQNYNSVKQAFQSKFTDPDKARLEYKATAQSLGMSEAQLDMYAKQNPKLVLRAAGLDQAQKPQHSPSYLASETNNDVAGRDNKEEHHDNKWWSEQRKKLGNRWYFRPEVQQKYWADERALGDSFLK